MFIELEIHMYTIQPEWICSIFDDGTCIFVTIMYFVLNPLLSATML